MPLELYLNSTLSIRSKQMKARTWILQNNATPQYNLLINGETDYLHITLISWTIKHGLHERTDGWIVLKRPSKLIFNTQRRKLNSVAFVMFLFLLSKLQLQGGTSEEDV